MAANTLIDGTDAGPPPAIPPNPGVASQALVIPAPNAIVTYISGVDGKKHIKADATARLDVLGAKIVVRIPDAGILNSVFSRFAGFEISAQVRANMLLWSVDGMGKMDSHAYGNRFMRMMEDQTVAMNGEEKFMTIAIFSEMKDPDRIRTHLAGIPNFAQSSYGRKLFTLLSRNVVKYVSRCGAKMPGVKVPESFPPVSLLAQVLIHPDKDIAFFTQQTFSCQFNLTPILMMQQKDWEFKLWTTAITSTKNTRDDGASVVVDMGFHGAYWLTKASDSYPLLNIDMTVAYGPEHVVTVEEWAAYITRLKVEIMGLG